VNDCIEAALPTPTVRKTIPPEMFWDVEGHKRDGLYFWLKSITATRPRGKVVVDGFGEMLMLGGYSYLGLNEHPRINRAAKNAIDTFGTGTCGSRLLAGTLSLHTELERELADFKQTEDAVVFSTGYAANVSTLSCLLRKGDVILSDKMNHASIQDGCHHSPATHRRFRHNDIESLRRHLQQSPVAARKLVVVDAVFSMDGDIADLPAISRICKQHGAWLMVDEAHSVGVLGRNGRGIEEHFGMPPDTIDIKMSTLSKAIPSSGGYVAGSRELCIFLRHEARSFVYSGSSTPASIAAAIESIRLIRESPELIETLQRKSAGFRNRLRDAGFDLGRSQTPIVPIIVGDAGHAARLARFCQQHGVFIQSIHPPVVPPGTARLRASITANHTVEDLERAARVLERGARELGILQNKNRESESRSETGKRGQVHFQSERQK